MERKKTVKRVISLFLAFVLAVQPGISSFGLDGEMTPEDLEFVMTAPEQGGRASASVASTPSVPVWASETYTITYGLDGGENSQQNPAEYSDEILPFTFFEPTKTGYLFDGWFTDPGKTEESRIETIETGTEGDLSVYAAWEPVQYTVSFLGNGAESGIMEQQGFTYDVESALNENQFAKIGYKFNGWNTLANGQGTSYANKASVCNLTDTQGASVELFAQWTPVSYKVRFMGNGATAGGMADQSRTYHDGLSLTENVFQKTGYAFAGWNTKADGSGTGYADKAAGDLRSSAGTATLYAQWIKVKYKITYVLNGGTNSSKNPGSYDVASEVTLQAPARTGYTFAGWYSDSKMTSRVTKITTGTTGEKTFYAKWTANKYTVKFDANGGTGKMSSLTGVAYDTSKVLTANAFSRTGYTFAGWSTTKAGSAKYKNKASIKNLSVTDGATVTLYAVWTKTNYKITYELNGGKNSSKNPGSYTITTSSVTLQAPTRTGYTFAGWYSDSKYKTKVTVIKKGSTGNKAFYARWTANQYSIKFDANGGTGKMGSLTGIAYDSAKTLTANAFKRTGYVFTGWSTTKTGSVQYKNKASVKNLSSKNGAAVTLYAQWKLISYSIKFSGNGSTSGSVKTISAKGNKAVTLPTAGFTKKGYQIVSWNTRKDGKGTSYVPGKKYSNLTLKDGETVILYAQWKIVTYKITYNGLGGAKNSSKNPSSYTVSSKTITLSSPVERTGYTFKGWYKESGFKTKVTTIPKGSTGTLKLYAKWELTKYKIRYNLNGGTNNKHNPDTYTIATNTNLQVPGKKGYTFKGWFTDSAFKNKITSIKKGSTGTKTVYAKWELSTRKIVYHLNGGRNNSANPDTFTIKDTVKLKNPTRSGYYFKGWYTDENFTDPISAIPKGTDGTVHLYARWGGPVNLYRLNDLPVYVSDISSYSGKVYTTTRYDSITYSWGKYRDSSDYYLKISCIGQKTYDYEGRSATNSSIAYYMITDECGNVVKNGSLFRSGLPCGYSFTETIDVYNIPRGDYYIYLYDYS